MPEKSAANRDYFKTRLVDFFAVCDRRLAGREFLARLARQAPRPAISELQRSTSPVAEGGGAPSAISSIVLATASSPKTHGPHWPADSSAR